jgi:hypothetical protein
MRFAMMMLLLMVLAAPAAAQTRALAWLEGNSMRSDASPECSALPDSQVLVVTFQVDAALGPVEQVDAMVDYCTEPHELLDWWRFDTAGQCRPTGLSVSADLTGAPSGHRDIWNGTATASAVYAPFHDGGLTHARIHVTVTPHPDSTVVLATGHSYYACRIVFRNPDVGCTGCSMPACFIVNEVSVVHAGGTYYTSYPGDLSNYVTWQGGQGNCPFIVPVEPTTWSAIKARVRNRF